MAKKKPAKSGRRFTPPEDSPRLVKSDGARQMPLTEVDKFLAEEEERAERKQEMIDSLLAERDEKIAEYDEKLARLGYRASVVGSVVRAAKSGITRQRDPNALCPICKIPGHDARKHRSQGKDKKPFSHDELVKLGLPVAS